MEKSVYWLKVVRKGATIVGSILLFVGILLDLIFRFLGISSLIGYRVVAAGFIVFSIIFALALAIAFVNDKIREKEKNEMHIIREVLESERKENKNLFFKFIDFVKKYENTIKLFFYTIAFCLSIYFSYQILTNKFYWEICYFVCLFFWMLFVLGLLELFFVKNKKTLITYCVIFLLSFGMLIWTTVDASQIYFDVSAKINLKVMDFLFLAVIILFTILNLIIVSDNEISKVKRTRNFGLGLVLLCTGVALYFVKPIAAFILKKWDTTADLGDRVQYLTVPMNIIMYIIIGVTMVAMLNVAFNTTHYIKTKNWLGLIDILASFICVVLCLIGILSMANFIAYLK